MDGEAPLVVVHDRPVRLLVSPVVPSLAEGWMQVGAAVEPSVTTSFAVMLEPVLNWAREPPALPTTFHSAWGSWPSAISVAGVFCTQLNVSIRIWVRCKAVVSMYRRKIE